jgi:hypothetical protein
MGTAKKEVWVNVSGTVDVYANLKKACAGAGISYSTVTGYFRRKPLIERDSYRSKSGVLITKKPIL